MRHHLRRTSFMALVFATSLLATGPAWADVVTLPVYQVNSTAARLATPAPTPASAISSAAVPQRVTYGGLGLDVPPGWTVVDLTADPTACVRFDVHVVYLGTPGAVQHCPAVLVGRTEAILLQPLPTERPYGTTTVSPVQCRSLRQARPWRARLSPRSAARTSW